MTSVSACLSPPPLPERLFRDRLEAERTRLLELECIAPLEHAGDLAPCSTYLRP
jgi:hypothetical protein